MTESTIIFGKDVATKQSWNDSVSQSVTDFVNDLHVRIIKHEGLSLEFDLINSTPALSNALRRILTSEIRWYAFHDVFISQNDSIFPDEYLAHRIGLIPVKLKASETFQTVDYYLKVSNNTKETINVYSNSIVSTIEIFDIQKDVLICKLAPKNTISMKLRIAEGIGKTHVKWSPVALCTFRLLPHIKLNRKFTGEDAVRLKNECSQGVIEIVNDEAFVKNPRLETMSREVLREFSDGSVELSRVAGHYCFCVEGLLENPLVILQKAILVLKEKATNLSNQLV